MFAKALCTWDTRQSVASPAKKIIKKKTQTHLYYSVVTHCSIVSPAPPRLEGTCIPCQPELCRVEWGHLQFVNTWHWAPTMTPLRLCRHSHFIIGQNVWHQTNRINTNCDWLEWITVLAISWLKVNKAYVSSNWFFRPLWRSKSTI